MFATGVSSSARTILPEFGACTMSLAPDEWARITARFDELRSRDAADRQARLDLLAMANAAVASEVRSLLEADADNAFLESDASGAPHLAEVMKSRHSARTASNATSLEEAWVSCTKHGRAFVGGHPTPAYSLTSARLGECF